MSDLLLFTSKTKTATVCICVNNQRVFCCVLLIISRSNATPNPLGNSHLVSFPVYQVICLIWQEMFFPPAQVQLVGLEEESSEFVCRNTFDHPYPTTKIMWIPDTKGVYPDLLATSGDYLRIWRVRIQITVFYIGKSWTRYKENKQNIIEIIIWIKTLSFQKWLKRKRQKRHG